ncbi:MAG TPA: hypothetical protein VFZ12_06580 [Dehalococcoidia bacterium]|nr:hypothetical protein [Dehalococcoidia bacterium]
MRRTIEKIRVEPAKALPQFQFKRQSLNAAAEWPEKDPVSADAPPSAPSAPGSPRNPAAGAGREPVLAATIAFLVLAGIVVAIGAVGYETLNLGSTSAGVTQTVDPAAADAPAGATTAFVDSLDLEVSEDGPPFLLTATLHIGSEPAILPDGDVVVVARIVGPEDAEYEVEAVADSRGNVVLEQEVDESGLYTVSVVEIRGEELTYDPARDDDALASVRAGDDEDPGAVERTVEQAETESEEVVETHTTSSEVDAGVATPEEDVEEEEEEPVNDVFSDANDDLFGEDDDEPSPTPTPDDGPTSPFPTPTP